MHVDTGRGIVHGRRRRRVLEEFQKHGQRRRSRDLEIVSNEALLERGDDRGTVSRETVRVAIATA